MISCIFAFYIAAFALPAGAGTAVTLPAASATLQGADPDALYAKREDLASAREAERLWQERLTAHPDGLRDGLEARAGALLARRPCLRGGAEEDSRRRNRGGENRRELAAASA